MAALGLGTVGAGVGVGGEEAHCIFTLFQILLNSSCCWRDFCARLTSWPESSSIFRSRGFGGGWLMTFLALLLLHPYGGSHDRSPDQLMTGAPDGRVRMQSM